MWLKCFPNPQQILFLQEHTFDTIECRNSMVNLKFKRGTVLWNPRICMEATHRTMKGMAILVNAGLTTLIKKQCVLVEGQVQWLILQFTPKKTLNVLNIYATFTSQKHREMWLHLAKNVPSDPSWQLQHVGTRCLDQQKHEVQRDLGLAATNNPARGGGCMAFKLLL